MIPLSNLYRSAKMAQSIAPEMGKLKKATADFEAVLLKDMLGRMRQSGFKAEPESHAMSILRDMNDQTMADHASGRGDFGVGKKLYNDVAPSAARQAYARLLREHFLSTPNQSGDKT